MSWLERVVAGLAEKETHADIIKTLSDLLGVDVSEVNDPSIKCAAALRQGLTPEVCMDFRGVRRWVLCRAWDLLNTGQAKTFRDAVRQAWSEARAACAARV